MATYAIGDIQGCADEFEALLNALNFRPGLDKLWLAGDLVNRGPKSLETLRLIYEMREHVKVVLGNHDLHLLAVAHGHAKPKKRDTINDILEAPDKAQLLDWLQTQPLIHHDTQRNVTMLHAGLIPQWSVSEAIGYANEVQDVLSGASYDEFFKHMYGNTPKYWHEELTGVERWRFITNVLTRIRYCGINGKLNLGEKGGRSKSAQLKPWFKYRDNQKERIIFGHWSTLKNMHHGQTTCLDTGCVWGGSLTAYCVDTGATTQVPSKNGITPQ